VVYCARPIPPGPGATVALRSTPWVRGEQPGSRLRGRERFAGRGPERLVNPFAGVYTGRAMPKSNAAATVRVRTFKADGNLLSRLAHDLELGLDDFELVYAEGRVTFSFAPSSLVVMGPVIDGVLVAEGLSNRHKAEIRTNIRDKVLLTAHHPEGRFEGNYVEDDTGVRVEGNLTLLAETRPVVFELAQASGAFRGVVELVPSRWGIQPFTAMFGALRLKDRVEVVVTVREREAREPG